MPNAIIQAFSQASEFLKGLDINPTAAELVDTALEMKLITPINSMADEKRLCRIATLYLEANAAFNA